MSTADRTGINTAYMVFVFAGQLTGTAVGNRLYAAGGWVWSGGCNIAFIGTALIIAFARGPREKGWMGWSGGWSVRRVDVPTQAKTAHVAEGGAAEASRRSLRPQSPVKSAG